ncbi:MAG TPA: Minf_1886 family protein [Patescibacteria group bacterium]|nr:Minf_1886 family protein [Patescibacteria group bacterium]
MKHLTETWKKIEEITTRDTRYKAHAYSFVMAALEHAMSRLPQARHVGGRELLAGIRETALEQFGPMAKEVFNFWGVYATEDFGNIVFNLVETGLLSKTDSDSIDDFIDIYDFEMVFEREYFDS